MEDLNDKITGNDLTAAEFIQPMSELQNVIEASGQTLLASDLRQLRKGLALSVLSIAVSRALTVGGGNIFIQHHTSAAGQGGGMFYWDSASVEADNNGTIIKLTSVTTGRYKRVYSGVINARWFGAIADGVTDDEPAIRTAGAIGVVYVPSGIYLVNSNLILKYGIFGDGSGQTILKQGAGVTTTFITLGLTSPNNPDAHCRYLSINGDQANNSSYISSAIVLNKKSIVEQVEIFNFNGSGMDASSYGLDVKILACTITGIGSATVGSTFGIIINVAAAKNLEISGCTIKDCRLNAILGQGTGTKIINNYFEGNHVQTVPTGGGQISVGGVATDSTMTIIANNYFAPGGGATASGMELNGHCSVTGNTLVGQKAVGIFLQQGVNHQLIGNVVKNGLAEAIAVAANLGDFMINSNHCYDDQATKTQTIGVLVNAGSSDRYTIVGNRLENNKTAALTDGGTGAVKSINGNTPLSAESWIGFTPVVTQGTTPTFTVTYARYRAIGKTGFITMKLVFDGTTSGTAGTVISVSGWPTAINPANPSGSSVIGEFFITNSGTAFYTGAVVANSATTFRMMAHNSGNYVGNVPNFGLTTSDTISINVQFNIV